MMAKRPKNEDGAKALLEYLGTPAAEDMYLADRPDRHRRQQRRRHERLHALQKKAVEFVGGAKNISQFMDRDTRPDFASNVMIPAIQTFIKNPNDIDGLTKSIEKQKKSIFATDG